MKKLILLAVAAAALVMATVALTAPSNGDELLKDEKHFLEQSNKTYTGGNKGGSASNMTLVGHTSLGDRGFNADVAVFDGYAYVGHWGFTDWATGNTRFCPSGDKAGVAVVDVRNPANPVRIATLRNPDGTSAEDMNIFTARYGPYAGRDIAAVGIQVCGGSRYDVSFFRGLQLFDVTDPANPVEIGRLNTGCCSRGLHETDYQHRPDLKKTYIYASVPASGYADAQSPSGVRDQLGRGDFRLIDVTDPSNPVEVSNWGVIHDLGAPPTAGTAPRPRQTGSSRSSPTGTPASSPSTSRTRRSRSTRAARSTSPRRTAMPTRRSTTTAASCSSRRTRTSARQAPGSRRATATCASTTSATSPPRCRSAPTRRRTRSARTIRQRATT